MPTNTPRLSLVQPIGTDSPAEIRIADTTNTGILDYAAVYQEGTLASRTITVHGQLYRTTDTGVESLSWTNGTNWYPVGLIPQTTSTSASVVSGQLLVTTGTGALTVTLPAAAKGARVGVQNQSTGGTTVSGSNIQGVGLASASSFKLGTVGAAAGLISDGTNWYLITGQQDTGWQTLTYGTNVSSAGDYTPGARLRGDTVSLRGMLQVSSGNPSPWATIPAGLRPASEVQVLGPAGFFTNVNTNGTITNAATGQTYLPLDSITYPLS